MKKSSFSYFPIVVAGVCLAVFVMTADAVKIQHPKYKQSDSDVIPGRYIVSFAPGSKKVSSSSSTFSIQSAPEEADVHIQEKYSHSLFTGAAIKIDTGDAEAEAKTLKSLLERSDVESITPIKLYKRPEVVHGKLDKKASTPSLLPHAMTQVDRVHDELNNKGKGILVAVLDTGIDYKHPAFGNGFGPGHKVSKGYDLVGDKYTGSNTPVPDSDPLDACGAASGASGHGTHVSGIIAGFDAATNFTGVAPEANLAMFRVFGCNGNVGTDVIIKALLMAYDAGADVINLSLGSTSNWNKGNPENDIVNKIVAAGTSVIISAGNSGEEGYYTVGQPSTAERAFSVASIENQFQKTAILSATGVSHDISYIAAGLDSIAAGEIVATDSSSTSTSDACTASQVSADVKGKIALIQRGSCAFTDKVANAASAGAVGVIIYNNADSGIINISAPNAAVPVISISLANGKELVAALKKGAVSAKFNKNGISPAETGFTVDSFSSTGSEASLHFKPNIAGVGGSILSTLPTYLGSWGVMSGTSMAAPYVAGSVALYIKSEGSKRQPSSFVYEQFQNYALPVKVLNSDIVDSPVRQGAGLVQVYDAITQKTHISPAEISFNDTATTNYRTQTITITNRGSKTISYELKNEVATGIAPFDVKASGYTPLEPAVNTKAAATLKFSAKTFKLAPGKSKKIKVTVTPPKTNPADHIYYGGSIHIVSKQQSAGKDLKVPYFGVVGVTKSLPLFDVDSNFPTIIDLKSNIYGPNDTFTYDRSDKNTRPVSVIRLLTPTSLIKAELLDPKTKKVVGTFLSGLEYLPRNFLAAESQYNTFIWDGSYIPATLKDVTTAIPAPAGTYLWQLSALKLLGDPKTKKDWEVWTSGPIIVKN